jgi:hypothetical protein
MSILSSILGVETSGGNNITQGNIGDINNRTDDLAQGYFQITGATWAQFGGLSTGYTSAIDAPASVQEEIAENIPVSRWGPATQQALQAAGYQPQRGETLGQMLTRYGENPADTVAADGSTFGTGGASGAYSGFNGNGFGSYNGTDLSGANTDGLFNNIDDNTFDGSDTPLGQGGIGSDAVASNSASTAATPDFDDVPDDLFNDSATGATTAGAAPTSLFTGSPANMTGISSNGTVGTQGTAGTIGAGGGVAVNLTDETQLPADVAGAGKAVQQGATQAGGDVQSAAGGIVQTAASIFNNAQTYASGALVMVGLIVMGLVFVAFGLGMFKNSSFLPKFASE